jgi:hypothetical protein
MTHNGYNRRVHEQIMITPNKSSLDKMETPNEIQFQQRSDCRRGNQIINYMSVYETTTTTSAILLLSTFWTTVVF